ncbi:hypothetical protein RFI_03672 [Reticulomyxa filosa]|uniref:Uncharacterized protein n=1 Tax=Reticulomyxa filosa TaxID=46433 RepID=X6P5S5_RETFI|nr:hypothetical protein RFI_03672 [Reticulomyxa filosa]|eukprot:ETO33434.1 hypothetical protein RFI_03672 [Reticulomyxa filosa]
MEMETILKWKPRSVDDSTTLGQGFGDKYITLPTFNSNDIKISKEMNEAIAHLESLKEKVERYLGTDAVAFVMEKCLEQFVNGLKTHIPVDEGNESDENDTNQGNDSTKPVLGLQGLQLLFVEVEFILGCVPYVTQQCTKYCAEFLQHASNYLKVVTGNPVEIDERGLLNCAQRLAQQKKQMTQGVVG